MTSRAQRKLNKNIKCVKTKESFFFTLKYLEIDLRDGKKVSRKRDGRNYVINPEQLYYAIYIFLDILSMVVHKCTALQYIVSIW